MPDSAPTEQWTPDQPLRHDATDEQILLRKKKLWDNALTCEVVVANRIAAIGVARELAAATLAEAQAKHDSLMRCQVEITRLVEAELTKLREDAARLDWLQAQGDFLSTLDYPRRWDANTGGDVMNWTPDNDEAGFATVREAIDAVKAFAARHATGEQNND